MSSCRNRIARVWLGAGRHNVRERRAKEVRRPTQYRLQGGREVELGNPCHAGRSRSWAIDR